MAVGRRSPIRWVILGLVVLLAAVFAYVNGSERVAIHLGFAILYRIPLVGLVFTAYLLGMLTMYLLGLRHDLRIRRLLREHGLEEPTDRQDVHEPAPPLPPDPYP